MKSLTRAAARGLTLSFAGLLLAGCQALNHPPPVDIAQPTAVRVLPRSAPAANNGAIYQADQYRPLFEDHRARLVGDTLTVQIVEKVSASAKSTSSVDKNGGIEAGITALPLVKSLTRASASATGSNTFEGKGATESSNDFTGTITVVVREVLPNGHLLVAGEKQIGVNNSVDSLRFASSTRALSRPATPCSRSPTLTRAAGQWQADAQVMAGWAVFLSVLPI
jgi:flagellar L-ring protein precursor FlgH